MSGSIPPAFIREIVDMTDIVALVDSYVPLKKKGKDHWGLCPFCDDGSNPSFSVSPQKQFYYCFKCRATGNVIGFLESFEGLGFVESVEALASRAALEVPYEQSSKKREDKDPIFEVLTIASNFYEASLADSALAKQVQKYVKEDRHISGSTCRRFAVGYAPKSWNALSSYLSTKGFSVELQTKAGLTKRNKDKEAYDLFRDRLMFPIKDRKGRVVGFGGRVMNPEDQPKYLNTGDTPAFQKGKELYGLFETLQDRKNLKKIYVVEGYMDVIAMSENGINNAVATLGIATNRFHTQVLLQLVNEVIFCFDGDDAGRGAAWGALKNVLPVVNDGAEIKFLFLPEGEDPASLLEKEDKETFETRLKDALLLSEYFIERLTLAVGTGSLEKKATLASKAIELLKSMPESSIKKLLEAEVSAITGLSKQDIEENSWSTAARKNKETKFSTTPQEKKEEKSFEPGGIIAKTVAALITFPELISEIDSTDWIKELSRPEGNLLVQVIEYFQNFPNGQVADLLSSLDNDSASFIGSLLSGNPSLDKKNSVAYFQDCLQALKKANPRKRIVELKKQLAKEKLSEDETFELQQHLLSNLEKLNEEDRGLLRELSQN
ncbi:MAG TPA: DNA primase [Gammaproteobacteria bacterium]|nr:DNA primase [Gammaproteobacteria bacterium]